MCCTTIGTFEFDDRRIIGVERHRFGIAQIVEPQVQRPARRNADAIGAHRLAIGEVQRDRDLRVLVARIEDAGGLVPA